MVNENGAGQKISEEVTREAGSNAADKQLNHGDSDQTRKRHDNFSKIVIRRTTTLRTNNCCWHQSLLLISIIIAMDNSISIPPRHNNFSKIVIHEQLLQVKSYPSASGRSIGASPGGWRKARNIVAWSWCGCAGEFKVEIANYLNARPLRVIIFTPRITRDVPTTVVIPPFPMPRTPDPPWSFALAEGVLNLWMWFRCVIGANGSCSVNHYPTKVSGFGPSADSVGTDGSHCVTPLPPRANTQPPQTPPHPCTVTESGNLCSGGPQRLPAVITVNPGNTQRQAAQAIRNVIVTQWWRPHGNHGRATTMQGTS
ncbi:hypothetical protein C8R45DRAFT_940590 [Mycena sanguinolenta]|nr:hypothetical protein C8R45DRAFT_940590 [Mycena sanguinolenta]